MARKAQTILLGFCVIVVFVALLFILQNAGILQLDLSPLTRLWGG
jgi:hypothetical protein